MSQWLTADVIHHTLQFLAGMEGDNTTGSNRNFFARLRIAPGTLWFVS
jgi:hypothetical protein